MYDMGLRFVLAVDRNIIYNDQVLESNIMGGWEGEKNLGDRSLWGQ